MIDAETGPMGAAILSATPGTNGAAGALIPAPKHTSMEAAANPTAQVALGAAPPVAGDRLPIDGVVSCACCSRFPLVGERVTRHDGRGAGGWVCASCEAAGRGDRLGPSGSCDRIRTHAGAANVRRAV